MLEYVTGSESHTSSWGKFYVKGLEGFVVKEDHPNNQRGKHANYQCYAGEIPEGTVFTIFEQSGDKRGSDIYKYHICQVDSIVAEQTIKAGYGDGEITGCFTILAQATTLIKSPRLMAWWDARPKDVDAAEYARHLAQYIDKRGMAQPPALIAA